MKKRLFFYSVFIYMLSGCSKYNEKIVEVTLPFYSGCKSTVSRAKVFLNKTSENTNYHLDIEIEEFDVGSRSNPEILGAIKLISKGEWKTLNGGSPEDYLLLQASGIRAECMPDSGVRVDVNEFHRTHRVLSKNSLVVPSLIRGELYLFYNDGAYINKNWAK